MINSISKSKIPKEYAYVLKTKQLENILIDNDIHIHVDLHYWLPQIIGAIFEVSYLFPNENVAYDRLYIRAGALLKKDVFWAREKIEMKVFPEFINWVTGILAQPNNSTQLNKNLYFNAVFKDEKIIISNSMEFKHRR